MVANNAHYTDILERMDRIDHELRELMQGIVFIYECVAREIHPVQGDV